MFQDMFSTPGIQAQLAREIVNAPESLPHLL